MKPVLQALLLADHVYRDASSGKHIIAGTFSQLYFKRNGSTEAASPSQPVRVSPNEVQRIGSPWLYLSLTELNGEVPLVLRYVSLTGDRVLFEVEMVVKNDDPLKTVEIVMPLPLLPNIVGIHVLELLWDNEMLGIHRIDVREVANGND